MKEYKIWAFARSAAPNLPALEEQLSDVMREADRRGYIIVNSCMEQKYGAEFWRPALFTMLSVQSISYRSLKNRSVAALRITSGTAIRGNLLTGNFCVSPLTMLWSRNPMTSMRFSLCFQSRASK